MATNEPHDKTIEENRKALEGYRADIENLKEKAAQFTGDVKKEFDAQLGELDALYKEAQKRYDELVQKSGGKLEEAKAFMALTYKALIHSYHYFLSHYRRK